mgnify:CR=1 FL=1
MGIIFKRETSLGLESYKDLGFNSEEELQLEISKLTKFRGEFDTTIKLVDSGSKNKGLI